MKGNFSDRKKFVLISIVFIVVIFLIVCTFLHNNHSVSGVDKYYELSESDSDYINFSIDEFGTYDKLSFRSKRTGNFLFKSYGSMFIAQYGEKEYYIQKDKLKSFHYQSDSVLFDSEKYALPQTEFVIDNWNFRVLENISPNYSFPKSIDFIAINDTEKKIAYMTFFDQDLDYLCEKDNVEHFMEKFIDKYFGKLYI